MVWNVIYAMKINKNYLNVIDAYLYVAQNVLINFILMKKANVQCVGYVDNILLVKKALISVFYLIKKTNNNYAHVSKPCFVACSSDFIYFIFY